MAQNILSLNDYAVYKDLEKNLLDQLEIHYERESTISDDLLESLYFIYKAPLLEALNQIDKYNEQKLKQDTANNNQAEQYLCQCIVGEPKSNRMVYQVKGSIGINYYLFESLTFCPCTSFKYNVLTKSDYIYCKHIILVKLLKAMKKISFKHVKDTDLYELIKQIH